MRTTVCGKTVVCGRGRTVAGLGTLLLAGSLGWLMPLQTLTAAELSVADLKIRPHGQGELIVSGVIDGESTYGVTIMLELVPHSGSVGTVEFTPSVAPPRAQRRSLSVHRSPGKADEIRVAKPQRSDVDIVQVGDSWPDQGSFTPFDTDATKSVTLNGVVDDNGTFIAAPVAFSGALSVFPVKASADAEGVWDVRLSTSRGYSGWEGVPTTLAAGTLTVTPQACSTDRECRDGNPGTIDTCEAGTCRYQQQDGTPDRTSQRKRIRVRRSQATGSH